MTSFWTLLGEHLLAQGHLTGKTLKKMEAVNTFIYPFIFPITDSFNCHPRIFKLDHWNVTGFIIQRRLFYLIPKLLSFSLHVFFFMYNRSCFQESQIPHISLTLWR